MIDQGELFAIPSPCRRICELNNRGYCKGCFRSRTERLNWLKYSDFQRQLIINLCEKRRLKVLAARNQLPQPDNDELPPPQLEMFDHPPLNAPVLPDIEAATEQLTTSLPLAENTQQMTATALPAIGVTPEPEQPSPAMATETPQPDQNSLFAEDTESADHNSQTAEVKTARRKAPRARKKADDQQIDLFS